MYIHAHENTGFTLSPASQIIPLGATATFTCQRMDGDVVWRIDGRPVNGFYNVTTMSTEGVHTLTIRNTRSTDVHNGSVVQCKAMFEDGREPELTIPAILQLQGKCQHAFIT